MSYHPDMSENDIEDYEAASSGWDEDDTVTVDMAHGETCPDCASDSIIINYFDERRLCLSCFAEWLCCR